MMHFTPFVKKIIIPVTISVLLLCLHQYFRAGPESAFFRQTPAGTAEVEPENLRPVPFPGPGAFEWFPDAVTTLFKRAGLGGWTEIKGWACGTGCVDHAAFFSDGFQTIDVALETFAVEDQPLVLMDRRWIRAEVWGRVRRQFQKEHGADPRTGDRLRVCGKLRLDDPHGWLELHPLSASDLEVLDSCRE